MTSATKRKHVVKEMLGDFSIPGDHQQVVEVLGSPGSNLHEVSTPIGQKILCSLPVKFRRNIWIKRGDFVVIESIAEGDKVKAEIVRILYPQHVKFLHKAGKWPREFSLRSNEYKESECFEGRMDKIATEDKKEELYQKEHTFMMGRNMPSSGQYCSSEEDDFSDIPANLNRPNVTYDESVSESDSDGSGDQS